MKYRVFKGISISIIMILFCLLLFGINPIRILRVQSGSMEPALKTGSLCVAAKVFDIDNVEVNDIIVFDLWDGTSVAHRVVGKNRHGLITKGDANRTEDLFTVTEDNLYGKVLFSF